MATLAKELATAERLPFADGQAALSAFVATTGTEFTVDGIHLNPAGYRVMADALQQAWGFGK